MYDRHVKDKPIVYKWHEGSRLALESSYPVDLPLMGLLVDQALALAGFTSVAKESAFTYVAEPKKTSKVAAPHTSSTTTTTCDSAPPSTHLIQSFGADEKRHTMHTCIEGGQDDRSCLFSNLCFSNGKFTYFRNPRVHLSWGETGKFTEMLENINLMTNAVRPLLDDVTPHSFAPPAFAESPIPDSFTRGNDDTTTFLAINR